MQSGKRKTLYSEIGIPETATREEVRAAFRRLAKEYHPDLAEGEDERVEASEKMSRLNEIIEVLGEEEARAEYDEELKRQRNAEAADVRNAFVAASAQAWRRKNEKSRVRWPVYAGAALLVLAGGWVTILLTSDSQETQWWQSQARRPVAADGREKAAHRPAATTGEADAASRPSPKQPRAETRSAAITTGRPDAAPVDVSKGESSAARGFGRTEVAPLVEEARRALATPVDVPKPASPRKEQQIGIVGAEAPKSPVAVPAPFEVAPAVTETARAVSPTHKPATDLENSWNGRWTYAEDLGGGVGGAFAPLSIEMQLSTIAQKVHGVYRARYQVMRRKYSDRVEFSFEGWPDREVVKGVWRDRTGTQGEFELRRVNRGVVQMNWWTTAFPRKGALASGMARLTELSN